MSFWNNLKYVFLNRNFNGYHFNKPVGLGNKYNADQSNLVYPFEEGYAKSSDVYAITNKIARNAKTLPWILKKKTGDKIETIESGELFDLIHMPSDSITRESFVEMGLLQYLLGGNVYLNPLIPLGFNTPSEVNLLHPQLVEIKSNYEGRYNVVQQYIYDIGGKQFKISPEEVTHLKYANPTQFGIDNLYGLSPLTAGFLTLTGLVNNQTASASILENQGVSGILSNESDYQLSPEERDIQQSLFDKKHSGAEKFGKVIQSMAKVRYTKLGLDPSQLKIIESKTLKMRDLCNIYDVSSVLFNDPQNRIQSNLTPAETAFWSNAVIPNLRSFISSYSMGVVSLFNKNEFPSGNSKYFIEVDTSGVEALQKDQKAEAEKDKVRMDAINVIMSMPIASAGKIEILISELDMTPEQAQTIVLPEGEKNKTLEILSSMSPLLGTKFTDKLTEEEARGMLNL